MNAKKQLIITADDFGMSSEVNKAVLKAYKCGILTSTSLMANAPAFEEAVSMLDELKGLSIGVHLNVMEFSTLSQKFSDKSLLYDKTGQYNNGFAAHFIKSYNREYLKELEEDFRLQIEKILEKTAADHIDSHVHVHAIPNIFKLVCKLAREYGIKNIRTQFEYPYFVPDIKKYLSYKYPINLIKLLLLDSFTLINRKELKNYELNSNENIIGVNYTGYMDINTLKSALPNVSVLTEVIFHPSSEQKSRTRYNEFLTLIDEKIENQLVKSEITLTNWLKVTNF